MPPSAGTLRVGRYFAVLLGLFVVLYAIVFWPHQPKTPKLGLDLEGGAQVILKAQTTNGKAPSKGSLDQAKQIIENRVNGLGVANAQVVTQGNDRIVVSVPGASSNDIKDVGSTALLQFRPLLPIYDSSGQQQQSLQVTSDACSTAVPSASPSATPSTKASSTAKPTASAAAKPSSSPSPHGRVVPKAAGAASATPSAATPSATPTSSASSAGSKPPAGSPAASNPFCQQPAGELIDQWKLVGFTPPTTPAAITALQTTNKTEFQTLSAAISLWPCDNVHKPLDDPAKPIITCSQDNTTRYLLGPVIVAGTEVKSAAAIAPGATQGQLQWTVNVDLKPSGQSKWASYTSKHNEQVAAGDIANVVADTLDSKVIVASTIQSTINGTTQITGNFTEQTATNLANSLKYGALPLNFIQETSQAVSPTLGSSQLKAGLVAGGIGLVLVIIYSLLYYRALGLVTIASLVVSGGLTYAMLVILGHQIGFTLTLAGIAGFIVAVGITADSFVVFFERIKDEVHEGRTARTAVPRAWERARRTILSADTVSLLAAVILYYFAAGDVKGFAFTLGLSTVLDLIVVFLFTHPLVALFSRSPAFGSARFTGLSNVRRGGVAVRDEYADVAAGPAEPEAATEQAPVELTKGEPATSGPATSGAASSESATSRRGRADRSRSRTPAKPAPAQPAERDTHLPRRPAAAPERPAGSAPAPGATAAERAAARRGRSAPGIPKAEGQVTEHSDDTEDNS
ncbi:MAG TPA: protein translocase subunit SecD [Jatrophihabitans sp.]|nr:protein translocase subunit SecD [Jatrophihabitans sp.]